MTIGQELTMVFISLISYPIFWALGQCGGRIGKIGTNAEKDYRFNFFVRIWIELYLFVSLGCILQLQRFSLGDWSIGINGILACFFCIFCLATPCAVMLFMVGFQPLLKVVAFEKTWGCMYSDFKAGTSPLFYVILCQPHQKLISKIVNTIAELTVLSAFILVAGFLGDPDEESLAWIIQIVVVIGIVICILLAILQAIIDLCVRKTEKKELQFNDVAPADGRVEDT
jgi:small-conductance mechanosensitive channel